MKKFLWIAVVLIAGCTHASVRMDTSGGTTTTTTRVSAGVSGHVGPAAWVLIGIGLIAAEAADATPRREPRPEMITRPAAPPAEGVRRVVEVDCTRPIADWSANLRCK